MLTFLLQEEHSVQKNQSLYNRSQQQSQAEIYHHSALLLQQAFHTNRVKCQVSRQANTGEPQTGIPIKKKKVSNKLCCLKGWEKRMERPKYLVAWLLRDRIYLY